jgi:hypothetical protein
MNAPNMRSGSTTARLLALVCAAALLAIATASAAHVDSAEHGSLAPECATCHFVRTTAATVVDVAPALQPPAPLAVAVECVEALPLVAAERHALGSRAPPAA